jgi:hypothetical protein
VDIAGFFLLISKLVCPIEQLLFLLLEVRAPAVHYGGKIARFSFILFATNNNILL